MASAAAAIDQAARPKPVDGSLWWDSFVLLFDELDNAPLSSDLPAPLVKKISSNHKWFLESVSCFKPPNEASRLALDSPKISIGSHHLSINSDLKEAALRVSSNLCLDEVQSYILVHRCVEFQKSIADYKEMEFLHLVLVQYCLERQCLLKCIRWILTHALYMGNGSHETGIIRNEVFQFVHDELVEKLLFVLEGLLPASFSEKSEVDVTTLWVEESLMEYNLVLDILFLAYYENFCACNSKQWKKLCELFKGILLGSLNIGKLAVSTEAKNSFCHVKVQLLLILIETLDLDNLLRLVFEEASFSHSLSVFSVSDVQEMDVMVSNLIALETEEVGPLILAWAVFVCLLLSLPDRQSCDTLLEIDHGEYVRQAMQVAPFNYLIEVLHYDLLRDSDGPVSGFLSVFRTLISSFISAYEIQYQLEDGTLNLILDILCQVYRGEETLCMQFWDRDSFVDGPIRSLLCLLESEFPFHQLEFIRLLSSLCEGAWPAECVYNFLDNMSGITLQFEIPGALHSVNIYEIVETPHILNIPGVEGLVIPSKTRGQVLKVIDESTALVRWQHSQSGVLLLLLHLAQEFHSLSYEEVSVNLDLLYRLVSFNRTLCFTLLGNSKSLTMKLVNGTIEKTMRIDAVKILSTLACNLFNEICDTRLVSMCINNLTEMLKCLPSRVSEVTMKTNFFGLGNCDSSSGVWLLSGGLARILVADCEQNVEYCPLTIAVLNYTMLLMEVGAEGDLVSSLVMFSLQYVLVNHEHWKYKLKYARWKVTVKVFEVLKKCIEVMQSSAKHSLVIREIVFADSSVHSVLFRVMSISNQALERLYVNRFYELKEVEGIQLAVCSALDIVFSMLAELSKLDSISSEVPVFVQTMLSSTAKPISAFAATISLISFFRDSAIQVAASRVLSILCCVAARVQAHSLENCFVVADDMQFKELINSIKEILDEEVYNKDLVVAVINLLTSAAQYQPAFFVTIMSWGLNIEVPHNASTGLQQLAAIPTDGSLDSKTKGLMGSILQYINRSIYLIESCPHLLLSILNFLKVLWEGGFQYTQILDIVRSSKMFWKHLASLISAAEANSHSSTKDLNCDEILRYAYRYRCQAAVLEIMAHDIFLVRKMSQEISEKQTSDFSKGSAESSSGTSSARDILSTWCDSSVVESFVKLYSTSEYNREIVHCAKMALSLCLVHLIVKLTSGDTGSLSLSLVIKMRSLSKKLTKQPAFLALLAQYSTHGYGKEDELSALILNDLYHHLHGELEGREITHGPFKELTQYLLELDLYQNGEHKHGKYVLTRNNDVYMFDVPQLQAELGVEVWDHSNWKASKIIAESALEYMRKANSIVFLSDSKLSALKALTVVLSVYEGNIICRKSISCERRISGSVLRSGIGSLCACLQDSEDSLVMVLRPSTSFLRFYLAQIELLHCLSRSLFRHDSLRTSWRQLLPASVLIIRTSASSLRFLRGDMSSASLHKEAIKFFFLLLLTSVEFSYSISHLVEKSNAEVDLLAEASLISLGLLPILCKYVESPDYCNFSVASIDLILKGFLTPDTWLPVLQKHLKLHYVIHKLQAQDSSISAKVTLKFLLTLAQIKGGAKMLHAAGCFSTLKVVFDLLIHDGMFLNNLDGGGFYKTFDKDENQEHIWGVGLAIITSMIYSLSDDSSCAEIVDNAVSYFFSEKVYMIYRCLSAPNFPSDDHNKKRQKIQKAQTSLASLRETEYTIMLMCALAKHQASWVNGKKENDSELRETCIHMLAFISKGTLHAGDLANRGALLVCQPILKIEVEASERPPFVGSKTGWFALSALGSMYKTRTAASTLSLVAKHQANENADIHQSSFTDMVAIQIYKIAFLLLKFLCLQAKAAAKRAEEVEFIDLAHFPELPMPEILHGIQDQTVSIITEVCEANRSKQIQQETQSICLLLMRVLEKALYLEFCVSQSCGIRPVLGRVADFSKEIKLFMQATEQHPCFKASVKSLGQIIRLVYPGLLQTDSIF